MIAAGHLIGNYLILSKIGTGGMGAVYLAEHPQIGKRVALKVIHRELSGNKEVVQRFFQEAKSVNRIGNEHIVEVHDFGVTPDGDHYYIMEYLDGRTLASVLARETVLHVMRALHIGAQIANALAATHAAGIIHRDLKPDNVMLMHRLGDPDFVKLLDFGLAKVFSQGPSAVKTAAGVLLGTPQYMSPEACESRKVDHRTDVYALGILLFQMMTGRLPFDGQTMGEVLVKQVTALPPAPRGLNPQIPPAVEQIILRCLAKPTDLRFQSALELRDALLDPEAYLRGSPPISPARSVAPGEAGIDANQVLAYAAAQQQPRPRSPSNAQTMIAPGGAPGGRTSRGMPVAVPDLIAPATPRMNTMRIATPLGYSSRPPRKMWPIVLTLGLLVGIGGGVFAVAMYGGDHQQALATDAAKATTEPAVGEVAGSANPGKPNSSASANGSPSANGSASKDVVVMEATSGSASAASSTGSGAGAPTGSAAGTPRSPASPQGKLARVTFETNPAGAMVKLPDGQQKGPTPITIEWPVTADEVTFEVLRAGYKKKPKAMVVNGNLTVRVELERDRKSGSSSGPSGKGDSGQKGSSDTGLMRPDDL